MTDNNEMKNDYEENTENNREEVVNNVNNDFETEKTEPDTGNVSDINKDSDVSVDNIYGRDGATAPRATASGDTVGVYTTPDGGNGYIYSHGNADKAEAVTRRKRKTGMSKVFLVALLAVVIIAMAAVSGFYGALAGRDYIIRSYNSSEQGTSDNTDNPDIKQNVPTPSVDIDKVSSIKTNGITEVTSAGNSNYSLTSVINMVSDSVVVITTEKISNSVWYGQYVTSGAGSGVIISENGYIVTNNHVIDGAETITVTLTDGTSYQALLLGTDEYSDIAVLWVDTNGRNLTKATLGCSADIVVGESVIAIGNPLGSLGGTVTNGIISATERQIDVDGNKMTLMQTNAAVSPGNSGGGLFNMAGQLIGIVNAKYSSDAAEGLGFAIPIDGVYDVITQLIQYGYVRGRVDHGLTLVDYPYTYGSLGSGVYIIESEFTDEIQKNDKLIKLNGMDIRTSDDIRSALANCSVGDKVEVVVERLVPLSKMSYTSTKVVVTLELKEYVPNETQK